MRKYLLMLLPLLLMTSCNDDAVAGTVFLSLIVTVILLVIWYHLIQSATKSKNIEKAVSEINKAQEYYCAYCGLETRGTYYYCPRCGKDDDGNTETYNKTIYK